MLGHSEVALDHGAIPVRCPTARSEYQVPGRPELAPSRVATATMRDLGGFDAVACIIAPQRSERRAAA